jgi:chromosome segregation protein
VNPERRQLIEPLLADVYLSDTLLSALDLSRRYPTAVFVTREGELAAAGGIVTGGVDEGGGQGLIHTKREIRELTTDVASLKDVVAGLDEERVEMRADLATAEETLRKTRNDLQQAELQLVHCDKDLQRGSEELQRLEERTAVKALEDGQLAEEKGTLEREQTEADAARAELEAVKGKLEADSAALQSALVAKRAEIEKLREGVTALKVKAATLREKRESNEQAVKRVEALIVDIGKRHASQLDEEEKGRLDHVRLTLEIAAGEETVRQLLQKSQAAEASLNAQREKFESLALAVQEQEQVLKGMRDKLAQDRDEANQRQLKLSELKLQLQHLESGIQERHRIEIATLSAEGEPEEFDEAVMQERQLELQRQVEELGEVNLMAIDEYRELEERHRFLSEQKADLEESMQELQKAIQRINRTTRKRFLETFVQVNEKFREVFPRLFCGGQAELRLTNEEDLLETGIEIIVQPPGKKLQNVSLLSGGEKALTAVALIFSIFLVKPSPFCLLDEVDAPLDDANISRFNEMIREMTEFSQFILITHSKTTMAVADTLYGVTMEEPGVSKVVSVRLQ